MSDMKEDQAKLIVYRGWLDRGKHVWSPFVIKLEARLRFAGVPYITEAGSTRTAPKGKIPYVECRGLGDSLSTSLGDSTLIIKHLMSGTFFQTSMQRSHLQLEHKILPFVPC
jgi:hypothetical protein